jgi:hypothetical protein
MLDFGNFSTKSFERLVQAITVRMLGAGVSIFGSGPDGGREATFEGEVPFPSVAEKWKGYIVVQAKCREKLRHNIEDANWLITQLQAEFEKFADQARNLRRPEYYLIATNVRLSSVAEVGGKDKVDEVLKKYADKLGFKGYHVWAADELEAILDSCSEIRKSYSAWITPSDVLAKLVEELQRPNLTRLLPLSLARDLRNERDARLRDAGQESEKSIFLDSVFVDLPVKDADQLLAGGFVSIETSAETAASEDESSQITARQEHRSDPPEGEDDESPPGVVALLFTRLADKLDPESCALHRPRGPRSNRIVILGGPGQGKSTIGQFVSQVARARLLLSAKPSSVSPQTSDLLQPIVARATIENIPLQGPARFPVRVDLPNYADALDKAEKAGHKLTLLAHMAARLSRELDCAINVDDLRAWLGACPWVVALDGLDEVPASGNRVHVVNAIDALWDEIHLANADVLVIVTSRPQGYQEALSRRHWEHWELAPLDVPQATRVANRLAEVRLSDVERRNLILEELGRAFSDPATRSLSTTPLQVTILFGIALLKGTIPQARWDLFEKYYSLLRDREAQKSGPDAALFRDFKRQIDAIHYEAGFVLQVAAESPGAAAPYLTVSQLTSLITRLLEQDDFDPKVIERVVGELGRIATERLVLLACRIEGQIAFEVRSLQEFMAAAQLTSAGPNPITERFRAIAQSAHWRHVYRIGASRIFSVADLSFLRADIVAICHALDSGDLGEESRCVKSGARLAIDLLADGVAASTPKFKRNLLRRALTVLDLGIRWVDSRLPALLEDETAELFREEIRTRIEGADIVPSDAAFRLLVLLLSRQDGWSEKILLDYWPQVADKALGIFDRSNPTYWGEKIASRLWSAQLAAGPYKTLRLQNRLALTARRGSKARDVRMDQIERYTVLPSGFRNSGEVVGILSPNPHELAATRFTFLNSGTHNFTFESNFKRTDSWEVALAVSQFAKAPGIASLCSVLEATQLTRDSKDIFRESYPWPVVAVLEDFREGAAMSSLIDETRNGRFGDVKDWERAERRWVEFGVRPRDFLSWNDGRYLNADIAEVGVPPTDAYQASEQEPPKDLISVTCEIFGKLQHEAKRKRLLEVLLTTISMLRGEALRKSVVTIIVDDLEKSTLSDSEWELERLVGNCSEAWKDDRVLHLLDRLVENRGSIWPSFRPPISEIDLMNKWRNLLPLFAKWQVSMAAREKIEEKFDVGKLDLSFREGDSQKVKTAIDLLKISAGLTDVTDPRGIAIILVDSGIGGRGVEGVLQKNFERPFRKAILLEVSNYKKEEELIFSFIILQTLQNELESTPSPLTDAKELLRLDLPRFPDVRMH